MAPEESARLSSCPDARGGALPLHDSMEVEHAPMTAASDGKRMLRIGTTGLMG